jgi:hypothetical protein
VVVQRTGEADVMELVAEALPNPGANEARVKILAADVGFGGCDEAPTMVPRSGFLEVRQNGRQGPAPAKEVQFDAAFQGHGPRRA